MNTPVVQAETVEFSTCINDTAAATLSGTGNGL
jgi:hypothetical protein